MLNNKEKRKIESVMVSILCSNPSGIGTRTLISTVHLKVAPIIPQANRHHIAGMIAWVLASTSAYLKIRKLGSSVIA